MRMDFSPETKLNQQLKFSYKSFADSSQFDEGSSPSDFSCDLNKNQDRSHLPKEIPLTQLASGSPNVLDQSLSDLKETDKDSVSQDPLIPLYAVSITFAIGVTIAMILHFYLGENLAFVKGVLVSDHKRCTALGQRVLQDRGSSVDAAITAALCLGVVHPHLSGVGGGGVMLVHDINRNETRVIDFQGTAPKTLREEMLLQNVSETKAGLHVGVPGLLRGLHHAHTLYGSLSWKDVVTRAAAVAKEGFNVSFGLAEAISKVKGVQLSQRFRDMFFPDGQALRPGSFLRLPSLAGVLEAGLSNFYDGNFSQEMEDEVRANGGVLSREDVSNYRVQVEQPVEGLYNDFIIKVAPPPSAGAALISTLNILQGFHFNEKNNTENQTEHWIAEALKAALATASGLGDPKYNSAMTELHSDMLSKSQADVLRQRISHSIVNYLQTEPTGGQVVVTGPDDLVVSLNKPFGSRIMTPSCIILNSLFLDFSRSNKTLSTNQKELVQPGKRPLSSLMPIIVVPEWHKCGMYMALSSSGGQQILRITKMLIGALSFHKEKNGSLSMRRLHPQLQPNRLLVYPEFPEDNVQFLLEKSDRTQRLKPNSAFQGILRNKDTITAITLPQLSASLL